MRKLSVLIFLLILFFVFPFAVSAQTATIPSSLKERAKDSIAERKAQIQTLRDQFKTRLQTIKDTRKQDLVDRLGVKLDSVNKKHTARFSEVLAKLQVVLDGLSLTEKDPIIVADIKAAQSAISLAKSAVEAQSEKEYVIQITTEANLRLNVGSSASQLRRDLMQTHKLVVAAKQAVMKFLPGKILPRKDATSSAN